MQSTLSRRPERRGVLCWDLRGCACLLAVVVGAPWAFAADPDEQARLKREVDDAAARLSAFCGSPEVWRYDNLRPTMRAVAPLGGIFRPPQAPVVHLSPGSPDYRRIVGQMMYLHYLHASRKQRLASYLAGQNAQAGPHEWSPPAVNKDYEEGFDEDVLHVEAELDQAQASYGRACAWAWPYINLRPKCNRPGFEAATILNPFLPVPTIRLSETSPDYKETVAALDYWEPKIGNALARHNDLIGDRKAAESAVDALARAAARKMKLPDKNAPPEDGRLAQMAKMYEQIKTALRRWRRAEHEIENLAEPYCITRAVLAALLLQAQEIQQAILVLQQPHDDSKDPMGPARRQAQIQSFQSQLLALAPQIAAGRAQLAKIENQIGTLRAEQARLIGKTDAVMDAWVHCCDVPGRYGSAAHNEALPLLTQWVAEEPRLWQLYLARGVARLHAGKSDTGIIADLKRAGDKVALYDSRSKVVAFVTTVQAYALCKLGDTRNAEKRFAEAKRLDAKSWVPHYFRGWSNLESGKYSTAKSDLQMAARNCGRAPEPAPYEAMGLLLATCPTAALRDGAKAVQNAARACELTHEQDWICLDTLAAAQAEAGDFDAAVKSANKALETAPADNQEPIRVRLALYRDKKPYRLK